MIPALKTLAIIDKIKVGDDPNGIIVDPKTNRVFTADRGSKRVTAIDARTGKIAGVIGGLGGRTEHLAADGTGHVFLNMQDRHTVLRLASQALKVLDTWPLTGCQQPSSMDMDRKNERVFIGCRSGVMTVVDGNTGKIVSTQPIERGVDAAEFDPDTGLVFFSTGGGSGALSIFHEDSPDKYTAGRRGQDASGSADYGSGPKNGESVSLDCAVRPTTRGRTRQYPAQAADDSWHVFSFGVREIGVVCRNRRVPPRAGLVMRVSSPPASTS